MLARWLAAVAAIALTSAACAACSAGSGQLTANSTCRQYLSKEVNARHDAATRISAQLHAEDGGNPMWGLDIDYLCNNNPNLTLHAAFGNPGAAPTETPTDQPTDATTDRPTDSSTETPTPSTSAPPADALGQIVLSPGTINNVCGANGSDQGALGELLDGGTAILTCSGTTDQLVGLDVPTGAVLWTHPIADTSADAGNNTSPTTTESLATGPGRHAYLLDITDTPASGLDSEYFTRRLTALDARTGATSWTQPLEPEDKQDSNSQATVTEAPGPSAGTTQVLVTLDEYSAFDATTGKPAWRIATPDTEPTYVGYNLALSTAPSDSSDATDLVATNLAASRPAWTDELPSNQTTISSGANYTSQVVGHTYWTFADTGYDTFDIVTGKHTGHAVYPTSWTNTLATPTYIAAYVSNTLRLFHIGSWSKPVWSVQASANARPLAMTDRTLLVHADSGDVLLNMTDGSILDSAVNAGNAAQQNLVDGLLPTDDGILELAPPK